MSMGKKKAFQAGETLLRQCQQEKAERHTKLTSTTCLNGVAECTHPAGGIQRRLGKKHSVHGHEKRTKKTRSLNMGDRRGEEMGGGTAHHSWKNWSGGLPFTKTPLTP